tara:strand:+ start:156842 stop:157888 length:1047 start_codon:yes stop_codon:yes gene_type:complete
MMGGTKSLTYDVVISPLFTAVLKPARFIKNKFLPLFGSGSWKEMSSSQIESAEASSIQTSPKEMKLLTYNIWGAPQDSGSPYFKFPERSAAVLKIIKSEEPDVICLQEVSADWAEAILNNPYIRDNFYSTDFNSERVKSYFGLSQIILSKYPIISAKVYGLPGYEIYTLLQAELQVGPSKVSVNNVHLHSSKQYSTFRKAQLETMFKILGEGGEQTQIVAGDFNFGDDAEENRHISKAFDDLWLKLKNGDPGYTEDTDINKMRLNFKQASKQERYDRVLLNGNDNEYLKPAFIKKIGTRPIDGGADTWPSDHFGLLTQFDLLSKTKKSKQEKSPPDREKKLSPVSLSK